MLEKGGKLPGIHELQGIGDIRYIYIRPRQHLFGLQEPLLQLVLRGGYPGVFLERLAEPRIADPEFPGDRLDVTRVIHILHQLPRGIDFLKDERIGIGVIPLLVIDGTQDVQHDTRHHLLAPRLFGRRQLQYLLIQAHDPRTYPDIM